MYVCRRPDSFTHTCNVIRMPRGYDQSGARHAASQKALDEVTLVGEDATVDQVRAAKLRCRNRRFQIKGCIDSNVTDKAHSDALCVQLARLSTLLDAKIQAAAASAVADVGSDLRAIQAIADRAQQRNQVAADHLQMMQASPPPLNPSPNPKTKG